MTAEVKTRLSNSILIGDIFGMLLFGLCIDRFGRRVGIYLTTLFLVLVRISSSAMRHGLTNSTGYRHRHCSTWCYCGGYVLDDGDRPRCCWCWSRYVSWSIIWHQACDELLTF